MVSALATGNLHLVIDVALPVSEPLKHEPLLDDAFCIVARAGHPIGKRVTLAKYLKSDHIAVSTRSRGTVIEDNALLNLGLERRIAARCQNYYSACRLVEQSDYLLTMPARLAQQVDATNTLTRFQPPFVVPAIQLHMYWHANNDADLPNAWLRSLISEIEADQGFV
jgi:DNA-binding transcriptional LysR family regulator